jgi:hypothetical protein
LVIDKLVDTPLKAIRGVKGVGYDPLTCALVGVDEATWEVIVFW